MYSSGSWYKKRDQETGFQIDLAFLRKDKIITLCEIKYANKISSKFIQEIANKESRLSDELRPDGIQKVLITVDPVDQSIVRDGSVDRCISLKELLKGN